jgi:hypothetical protein
VTFRKGSDLDGQTYTASNASTVFAE